MLGIEEIAVNISNERLNKLKRELPTIIFIIKEQARNTMTTVGVSASVVYIMRYLGFEGQFVVSYKSYWSFVLGWFIGLVLKAYYNKQN